ncbi:D-alanine--D-alanine ligase family protein [Zongyangia hominis]|uniref:D-alanine--D-alanine ligase n=1 Tax=Zongyangia hominis TaxID=2763677 RepID=A0A926EAK4_9FIRM|nr:D-alanine--D-alanine ligase family protein [Zongyangia hominis]MBC8570980.1 D-alanine--D-alanine ligase [Zongyangia hominis]
MSRLCLGVLFGGASSEHEVSLVSGASVLRNVPRDRYDVVMIGITKDGRWYHYTGEIDRIPDGSWEKEHCTPAAITPDRGRHGLTVFHPEGVENIRLDAVFPVLHGKNGEDGTMQGLLELSGIPCVGCGTLASAACMDKTVTRTLLEQAGIAGVRWEKVMCYEMDSFDEIEARIEKNLGYPVFVKPANAGSSVGISKARDKDSLKAALEKAFVHDRKVIVEEAVVGDEVECAVLGNDDPFVSVVGEIVPEADFYDYDAKYKDGTTALYIPARIEPEVAQEIRRTARQAFLALHCAGFARVDFFVRKSDRKVLLNEPNTIPGFTDISMYPKLMEHSGVPYPQLIDKLVQLAMERAGANG